jgi:hypothetical protein
MNGCVTRLGRCLDLRSLLLLFPGIVGLEMAETTKLDDGEIDNDMANLHFLFKVYVEARTLIAYSCTNKVTR